MSATLEDMKSHVSALTPEERWDLLDYLETSTLDQPDDIRAEWSQLARSRLAEHDAGRRQSVPFDTVFSRVTVE